MRKIGKTKIGGMSVCFNPKKGNSSPKLFFLAKIENVPRNEGLLKLKTETERPPRKHDVKWIAKKI